MSDTPDTDAALPGYDSDLGATVSISFACSLERHLTSMTRDRNEARKENDVLRGLLGNSAKQCVYCGLAAKDQAKCAAGFPGCSRADDQSLSEHFAAGYELEQAVKHIEKIEAERDKARACLKVCAGLAEHWRMQASVTSRRSAWSANGALEKCAVELQKALALDQIGKEGSP